MSKKKLKKRIRVRYGCCTVVAFYEVEEVAGSKIYRGVAARIAKDSGKRWAVMSTYVSLIVKSGESRPLSKLINQADFGWMWDEVGKTETHADAKKLMEAYLTYAVR